MNRESKSNFYIDGLAYDLQQQARGQWEMGNDFFFGCKRVWESHIRISIW